MKPIEILIVDDSKPIRMVLKKILEEINANVHEAVDGIEGYKLITKNKYDLVFMDINMPGHSGLEVIHKIRTNLKIRNLPIIVVTSLDRDDLIQKAFEVGANDYIRKPLNPVEVISRLKERFENYELLHKLRLAYQEINKLKEVEKENIFRATLYGTQHIVNNLLNKLNLVKLEIDNHPDFDPDVKEEFIKMKKQASSLLNKLSSVEEIEEDQIKDSIYPK